MTKWVDGSAEQESGELKRYVKLINIFHNSLTGWVVLCVSLVITVAAYTISGGLVEKRAEEKFRYHTLEIEHAIQERLGIYEQALRGGVGLFNSSSEVSRDEWKVYIEAIEIKERLPGIQGMGFAVAISADRLAAHIEGVRAEGFPDYVVKPTTERKEYSAIIYLEPFDWRNRRAFGYDMWSNEIRRDAMARARDEGEASTSGIITLVQETESDVQRGFLTYLPVYGTRAIPEAVEERRAQLHGWVYAAFRAKDLMEGVVRKIDEQVAFSIYDGEIPSESSLLYRSDDIIGAGKFDRSSTSQFFSSRVIILQGRPWTLEFRGSTHSLLSQSEANQPLYVLIAGLIVDVLLFYVIMAMYLINRKITKSTKKLKATHEENQKLLSSQAQFLESKEYEAKAFFDLVPDALIIVSAGGDIVRANVQAHTMFGYEGDSLLDQNVDSLVPEEFKPQHKEYRENYSLAPRKRHMSLSDSLKAVKKNGDTLEVSINLVPIELNGEFHTVASIQDISQHKLIERTLEDARERAVSASQSKSDFLANMSHEIRTPLNAVLGSAQLLEKYITNSAQRKYINIIRNSGEALLGIINDILDFSKIEAGKMILDNSVFDLDDMLARIAMIMSVNCGEKDIELVVHVDEDVPRFFNGDSLRIQQVIINLVSNAIKFTEKGFVTLSVKTENPISTEGQQLLFSVSDSGLGLTETQVENLFSAFSQADTSITRRFGGTGLGLTISNSILALMDSRIHIKSRLNFGSTFSFKITLLKSIYTLYENSADLIPKNAVVISSKEESATSMTAIFQRWQANCHVFTSINQFVDFIHKNANIALFDCIVMDQTSVNDAEDKIQRLRQAGFAQSYPIVILQKNAMSTLPFNCLPNVAIANIPLTSASLLRAFQEALSLELLDESPLNKSLSLDCGKLLLVEDNLLNQSIACEMLSDMNVDVDIANNGQEAIDMLKNRSSAYPVILMDIQMPVMDGITATKYLRRELGYKGPIVAMTAGVLESERAHYLHVGIDDLVPKPIDMNNLYSVIKKCIGGINQGLSSVDPIITTDVVDESQEETEQVILHFDDARLHRLINGKPERVEKISAALNSIFLDGESQLQEGWQKITDGDRMSAKEIFHSFKGVTANYGANYLRECIQALELALMEERGIDDIRCDFEKVEDAFLHYVEHAKQWLKNL